MRRGAQDTFRERIAEAVRNHPDGFRERSANFMRDFYRDIVHDVDWFNNLWFEDISWYDQDCLLVWMYFDFANFTSKSTAVLRNSQYVSQIILQWDAVYWYEDDENEYDVADNLIELNDLAWELLRQIELPKWDFTFVNVR